SSDLDSLLAAAVIGRAHGAGRVATFLTAELQRHPDDLLTQCAVAALLPEATLPEDLVLSDSVRRLAATAGGDLALLAGMLEEPAFAPCAVELAERFVAEGSEAGPTPTAYVLLARALARAGRDDELGAVLARAGPGLVGDPLLVHAAFDILTGTGSPVLAQSPMMHELLRIVLRMGQTAPPPLIAAVLRHNRSILDVPGMRRDVLPIVSGFWVAHPVLAHAGFPEVDLLLTEGRA